MRRPFPLGARSAFACAAAVFLGTAWWWLDLSFADLWPREAGRALLGDLFGAAMHPALEWESEPALHPKQALWMQCVRAVWNTLSFALAALALATLGGLAMGLLASSSWWRQVSGRSKLRLALGGGVWGGVRALTVVLRSVHELLWAVLLLAMFGLSPATGVIALALPYAGGLAKVYSEMLDESATRPAEALTDLGAPAIPAFLFGRLSLSVPDMLAYTFYRLECGLRSSAVLGFFGFETLGLSIRQSFVNLHFRELWTYLYCLLILIVLFELWSGAIRRRLLR